MCKRTVLALIILILPLAVFELSWANNDRPTLSPRAQATQASLLQAIEGASTETEVRERIAAWTQRSSATVRAARFLDLVQIIEHVDALTAHLHEARLNQPAHLPDIPHYTLRTHIDWRDQFGSTEILCDTPELKRLTETVVGSQDHLGLALMALHRLSTPGLNAFVSALEASAKRSSRYLARTREILLLNSAHSLAWATLTNSTAGDVGTSRDVREERDRIAAKMRDKFMAKTAPSSSFLQRTIEIAAVRSEDEWLIQGFAGNATADERRRIEQQKVAIGRASEVFSRRSTQSSCGASFAPNSR